MYGSHSSLLTLLIWLVAAYLVVPFVWRNIPQGAVLTSDDNPRITQTGDQHPGDPLNVALIGTEAQLESIMKLAKWSTGYGTESEE